VPAIRPRLGSLRRLVPISRDYGLDRGTAVDRVYIEAFLETHAAAVRGRVLEVGEPLYGRRYGSAATVDVLDPQPDHPDATMVGDLADPSTLPEDAFDCVICTQVLQFVHDVRAAVRTLHRSLRPGGVALVTVPGISQICPPEFAMSHKLSEDDYPTGLAAPVDRWRMTVEGASALFEEAFGAGNVRVEGYGNLRAATGFLEGRAAEDFSARTLDAYDPAYPVLVGVCALRPGA